MQSVTDDLSRVDEPDVRAMATYLATLQRPIDAGISMNSWPEQATKQ
jgi:hypothetical protein